jgi:hypothetical protein
MIIYQFSYKDYMTQKNILYLMFLFCFTITNNIIASNINEVDQNQDKKIIAEFKNYLETIPLKDRQEIEKFRTQTTEFNKQKQELFKKLSQHVQNYLGREAQYKKTLSKKISNLQNQISLTPDKTNLNSKNIDSDNDVIDQFKKYLATIKPETRKEIEEYRIAIVEINKQKQNLFKSLSQNVQAAFTKEREFKQRIYKTINDMKNQTNLLETK